MSKISADDLAALTEAMGDPVDRIDMDAAIRRYGATCGLPAQVFRTDAEVEAWRKMSRFDRFCVRAFRWLTKF